MTKCEGTKRDDEAVSSGKQVGRVRDSSVRGDS